METFNVVYRKSKNLKELLTPSLFQFPGEANTSVLTRATLVKTTWSLVLHLFVLLLVNVNMLGLPLLLNNVSIFISQILKPRKVVAGLLGTLILFASIQVILMVT